MSYIYRDPIAVDDYAIVEADGKVGIHVLANDFGDELKIKFAATDKISVNGGTIKLNNNGTPHNFSDDKLVYRPAADFTGFDSFTYAISDGKGGMDMTTVKVKVQPANRDPVAVDDYAMVEAGGQVGIKVLLNDFDLDGDALRIKFAATDKISANGGTIKLNNNGTPHDFSDDKLVYRPAADFTGVDSFTYAISDNKGGMDMATVKVKVKAPIVDLAIDKEFIPTVQDEFKIATYGENISFTLTATNNSSVTAKNVVITDEISQLENITISDLPLGGSYTIDPETNILKITIPKLAGGEEATFTVSGDVVVPEELVIFNFFGQLANDNPELQEYASTVVNGTQYLDLNLTKEVGSSIVRFNFNSLTNSADIDAANIHDPDLSNNTSSDKADIAQAKYTGILNNNEPFELFVAETDPNFQDRLDPINPDNPSDSRPFIDVDWGSGSRGTYFNNSQFLEPDQIGRFSLNLFWDNAEAIEKGVPGGLFEQFLALEADGNLTDSSDEQAILNFLAARIAEGDAGQNKFVNGSLPLLNTETEATETTDFTQGQYTPDLGQADIVTIVVASNGVFESDVNGNPLPISESLGNSLQEGLDNLDPATNPGTVLNIVIDDSVTRTRLQTLSFNSLADKGYFVKELDIQSESITFISSNHPANVDLSLIEVTEVTPNSLTLTGGHAKDIFIGSNLAETIYGDNGKDQIAGGLGNDLIFGGKGNDLLRGDGGNDIIIGGAGRDVLRGSFGLDTLIGGYYDPKTRYLYKKGGDIYVLEENAGLDTVKGFAKNDAIGLLSIDRNDLDLRVESGSTIISLDGEDLMLIEGIDDPHDLNFTDDFHMI